MYNNLKEMKTFKCFHFFAIDGSMVEIPNHLSTWKMEIPPDNKIETFAARARISCTVDTKNGLHHFIHNWKSIRGRSNTSIMTSRCIKNKINMNKVITCYDMYYNSKEIMFKTETLNSYHIIRGKTSIFKKTTKMMNRKKQTKQMI